MTMLAVSDPVAGRIRALAEERGLDIDQLLAEWAEAAIEAIEDAEDNAALEKWRANPEPTISYEELRRKLDLP